VPARSLSPIGVVNVRFWHKADLLGSSIDVRFEVKPDIDVLRAAYLLPLPRSAKTTKAAEVSRRLSRLLLDRPKPALLYLTTMSVIDPKERETCQ
jgi:hypothetical protein